VAVIATHFPGIGSTDRQPDEEIATVRKSLELLKQVELAPFFTVTNLEQPSEQIVDGLLLSHTRYQGFQGNVLTSTKPISFDAIALETILALPEIEPWRKNGGIIISDDLGSEAVRKYVDPLGTGYDARQVARTALMAGNDMLLWGISRQAAILIRIPLSHERSITSFRNTSKTALSGLGWTRLDEHHRVKITNIPKFL